MALATSISRCPIDIINLANKSNQIVSLYADENNSDFAFDDRENQPLELCCAHNINTICYLKDRVLNHSPAIRGLNSFTLFSQIPDQI